MRRYFLAVMFIVLIGFAGGSSHAQDDKAVVPFIDGMTINTSDSVASVEVRAQSIGPGFCASRFSAGQHTVDILAPPLTWSDWVELTAHIGAVSFTLGSTVMCDTGVLAEVRYYPAN